jgi:hypothetical protein
MTGEDCFTPKIVVYTGYSVQACDYLQAAFLPAESHSYDASHWWGRDASDVHTSMFRVVALTSMRGIIRYLSNAFRFASYVDPVAALPLTYMNAPKQVYHSSISPCQLSYRIPCFDNVWIQYKRR